MPSVWVGHVTGLKARHVSGKCVVGHSLQAQIVSFSGEKNVFWGDLEENLM